MASSMGTKSWSSTNKERSRFSPQKNINNMNSITGVKDDLIACEIQRIELLMREELIQELIDLKSTKVEQMSDNELLNKLQIMANLKKDSVDDELFCRKCGKSISKEEVELNDDEMCSTCYAERHE